MRNYEVAVVLHPDLEIDLENAMQKIENILTKAGAKITKKDNWGKRKLAYKIQKQDWGIYVFYQIEIDPGEVNAINQKLRITEEVMRYLIVSLEDIKYLKQPTETKTKTTKKAATTKTEDKK